MRCVFLGTGGFLGRIDGETRCAFWIDEPVDHDFDPARLIHVDLARTPTAAAAKEISWDEVQVEDCYAGPNGTIGGTTLGPRWPELPLGGAIYLEQSFAQALPAAMGPTDSHNRSNARWPYECMTTVYWTPTTHGPKNRYAYHHAEIPREQGTLRPRRRLLARQVPAPAAPPARMWIDLASPEQCDASTPAA
jgi:hypothetical protein